MCARFILILFFGLRCDRRLVIAFMTFVPPKSYTLPPPLSHTCVSLSRNMMIAGTQTSECTEIIILIEHAYDY